MSKNKKIERIEDLSRRKFLSNMGKIAVGTAIGLGGLSLTGCSAKQPAASTEEKEEPKQAEPKTFAWPWPYKKLDPKVVGKRAYENYFNGGCMYAVASSLILTLREEVGAPYDYIPVEAYKYGSGGVAGWGTLCGALNGASAVINMVSKDYAKICNELMGWYTQFEFPSKRHDEYAKFKDQITTVANSPLCHVSVSKWCKAAGAEIGDAERKDRCAKVSGDVAVYTVELLNSYVDGAFKPVYKPQGEFESCLGCHAGKNEVGKMDCLDCHEDPHD